MRWTPLAVAILLLSLAGLASAELCPTCQGKVYTKDIGACRDCGGPTTSGAHALCVRCSTRLRQCEHCRACLPDLAPPDASRAGSWRADRWEYRVTVSNEGSKSEGRVGALLVDGKAVAAAPAVNDHLRTPWGVFFWVGDPPVPFGAHGWMPQRAPARPMGRLLVDPAGSTVAVLWMWHLVAGPAGDGRPPLEPWMAEALKAQGDAEARVSSPAEPLGGAAVVLHDSKHYGRAEARLARAVPGEPVVVEVSGTTPRTLELPWKDGETRVQKHVLESSFGPHPLWLAFRLEVATPPPAPPARAGGGAAR